MATRWRHRANRRGGGTEQTAEEADVRAQRLAARTRSTYHSVGVPGFSVEFFSDASVIVEKVNSWWRSPLVLVFEVVEQILLVALDKCWGKAKGGPTRTIGIWR